GRLADRAAALEDVEVHLALAEEEEVAVARVAHVEGLRLAVGRRPEEEGVAPVCARPRRRHLDPKCRRPGAKGVRHADGDDAARARPELDAASVEVEHRLALEDVEAGLERVHVRVDVPVVERDERQRHVRRAERAADEAARAQPARMSGQRVGELDVLAAHEPVARHPVREVTSAGFAHAPSPTTAAAATASAAPLRPASPFASRSAPRTYSRPATRSSSAGKRVITSQPVAVTTTSSSILAAERPSVAAQYVSSANTIPSSISTGCSSEWTREIIGGS